MKREIESRARVHQENGSISREGASKKRDVKREKSRCVDGEGPSIERAHQERGSTKRGASKEKRTVRIKLLKLHEWEHIEIEGEGTLRARAHQE